MSEFQSDTIDGLRVLRVDSEYGAVMLKLEERSHDLSGVTRTTFDADPATADRIASALHVAAAQVRAARGEKAPELTYDARIILNRVDGKDLDVEDVRRIARNLNAWLAAHEAGK